MINNNFISEKTKIKYWDVDGCGYARPSTYLKLEQSIAEEQIKNDIVSLEELRRSGKALFLSRVFVTITNHITSGENVISQSWPCKGSLASLIRCGHIFSESGEEKAIVSSSWACVHLESRKLLRATEFGTVNKTGDMIDPEFPHNSKVDTDAEWKRIGQYTVTKSDIDYNNHMNNVRYPDLVLNFCDILPMDISFFSVHYMSELNLNDSIDIIHFQHDNINLFRLKDKEEKIKSEIVIRTKND